MLKTADIRIGSALQFEGLSVFPIFPQSGKSHRRKYKLLSEALGSGELRIAEVDSHGNVPTLSAEVIGEVFVLIFGGEVLKGGKQNRVINTSILLTPRSHTVIPVSCVEQQRWRPGVFGNGEAFVAGDAVVSPDIRSALDHSVTESSMAGGGFESEQGTVWARIHETISEVGANAHTRAFTDAVEHTASSVEQYASQIEYPDGAIGLCTTIGGRPKTLHVYSGHDVCKIMWPREVKAAAIDAIRLASRGTKTSDATAETVANFISGADQGTWADVDSIGFGTSKRSTFNTDSVRGSASVLVNGKELLHLSITG